MLAPPTGFGVLFCLFVLTRVHLQDLYQRCEKMRPTLFRLASDTEDSDEALGKFADPMTLTVCHIKAYMNGIICRF